LFFSHFTRKPGEAQKEATLEGERKAIKAINSGKGFPFWLSVKRSSQEISWVPNSRVPGKFALALFEVPTREPGSLTTVIYSKGTH